MKFGIQCVDQGGNTRQNCFVSDQGLILFDIQNPNDLVYVQPFSADEFHLPQGPVDRIPREVMLPGWNYAPGVGESISNPADETFIAANRLYYTTYNDSTFKFFATGTVQGLAFVGTALAAGAAVGSLAGAIAPAAAPAVDIAPASAAALEGTGVGASADLAAAATQTAAATTATTAAVAATAPATAAVASGIGADLTAAVGAVKTAGGVAAAVAAVDKVLTNPAPISQPRVPLTSLPPVGNVVTPATQNAPQAQTPAAPIGGVDLVLLALFAKVML